MNVMDSETRRVLGPAGNKAMLTVVARKTASKKLMEMDKVKLGVEEDKKAACVVKDFPLLSSPTISPAVPRMQESPPQSILFLNASCSSDASTGSMCARASTERTRRQGITSKRRQVIKKPDKVLVKLEKVVPHDATAAAATETLHGIKRCAWVTPNTDPAYVTFHDEEWGVPVHDDRKLFELLVLSGALAELTWPAILGKRHVFRKVFMDFDPMLVSKLNEKKLLAPGSNATSLLSELRLRAVVENGRLILKIIEEFGSFNDYCWSYVNHKPITSKFRYPHQVPVKTPKAELISRDLVGRGFRSVAPTAIYSFMQAAGITNDHLVGCYRFEECSAAADPTAPHKEELKVNRSMIEDMGLELI